LLGQCCHGKLVGFAALRVSSLKTEWIGKKVYRSRAQAKADVFDYIKCFYNPARRHSTLAISIP
jgi:putative transposase